MRPSKRSTRSWSTLKAKHSATWEIMLEWPAKWLVVTVESRWGSLSRLHLPTSSNNSQMRYSRALWFSVRIRVKWPIQLSYPFWEGILARFKVISTSISTTRILNLTPTSRSTCSPNYRIHTLVQRFSSWARSSISLWRARVWNNSSFRSFVVTSCKERKRTEKGTQSKHCSWGRKSVRFLTRS